MVSVGHNNGFVLLLERLRLLFAVTLARGDESPKMRKILKIAAGISQNFGEKVERNLAN